MRITPLDNLGNLLSASNSFVTDTLVKASMTQVVETGDAIAVKGASGELPVFGVHGDIPKWFTASIELAVPDPYLEQALTGGVTYSDTSAAAGTVTGVTVTGQTTLGQLAAGLNAYRVSQYNSYGESVPSAEVTVTNTGATSTNIISGMSLASSCYGWRLWGRTPGGEQFMQSLVGIGAQTTSAASGTGAVTSLSVTALTKPIPAGYTFQIAGDTNSPKIVFTTTAEAGVNAVTLQVTASQSVTTPIAAAAINPVFVDTGVVTPSGLAPTVDMTAGPGNNVGYQIGAMGAVQNPNGVAVELFCKRWIKGVQATDYPYWRHVWPMVKNLHMTVRDYTNANLQTIVEGHAFQNANFGSGPDGTWQFDSSKAHQRAMCGAQILPVPSVAPFNALY
jgi:hypothetical protein